MSGYDPNECTEACEAMPECASYHRRKAPTGRDVAAAASGGYCDRDCPGYRDEPRPGHLWPGELRKLRHVEPEEPSR